jgi:hypothetical protein
VYGSLRGRAKSVVEELKRRGIDHAHVEGNDEMVDILRLTCIEAGIRLIESPNGVVLKAVGQEYRIITAN